MLRASARVLAAAKETTKLSTGLTGLAVDPNWSGTLSSLCDKALRDVQVRALQCGLWTQAGGRTSAPLRRQVIPEHVFYRQEVEQTMGRLKKCAEEMSVRGAPVRSL